MPKPLRLPEPTICDMNCFYPPNHAGRHQFESKEEIVEQYRCPGCCASSSSFQKMEDPYKVAAAIRAKTPVEEHLDQLSKNLEGLGLALEELKSRLQPVSSQLVCEAPGPVDAPYIGSSDLSARLFNYCCRTYSFTDFVSEMIRDLEV